MYFPVISEADALRAKYYKDYASDRIIRQRMHIIYLRSKHYGPGACAEITGVHPNSVTNWSKAFIANGLDSLLNIKAYRPKSDLLNYVEVIRNDFEVNPPRSVGQARKRIQKLTGLSRGITQIRKFLKDVLDFRYRKFRPLPGGKKSIEELAAVQADFLKTTLNPLLGRAKRGAIDVYFVDAAHPVQGFHDGCVWSKNPVSVRTSSGRQRMNILGALHATNQGLYSVTTTDYITATSVVDLIEFIRSSIPGRRIYLVMDNARYQRCNLVTQAAKKYRVNLVFLPAYSPNLNLIERFWKYLKSTVLAGVYFENKFEFLTAIEEFLEEVNSGVHKAELASLLTLNFQQLKAA